MKSPNFSSSKNAGEQFLFKQNEIVVLKLINIYVINKYFLLFANVLYTHKIKHYLKVIQNLNGTSFIKLRIFLITITNTIYKMLSLSCNCSLHIFYVLSCIVFAWIRVCCTPDRPPRPPTNSK